MSDGLLYFRHKNALVESETVGRGTSVWAFAHVLSGASIGEDCNLGDHTFVENDVMIGNRVTLKSGVQVWDGITLEDDVFVGPNATFTNDRFPRSKQYPEKFLRTIVKRAASIGANATILPGITIGERAMVGAGAVVTHSVPPFAMVAGNPARIIGYDGAHRPSTGSSSHVPQQASVRESTVLGVTLHRLPSAADMRGHLTFGETERHIPFPVQRFFLVYRVPGKEVRGEHAHYRLHQFLVCVHGSCSIMADDGQHREEFLLDDPTLGIHLPPLTWGVQYKYSADAVLLVLASDNYDPDDYIREYPDFLRVVRTAKPA